MVIINLGLEPSFRTSMPHLVLPCPLRTNTQASDCLVYLILPLIFLSFISVDLGHSKLIYITWIFLSMPLNQVSFHQWYELLVKSIDSETRLTGFNYWFRYLISLSLICKMGIIIYFIKFKTYPHVLTALKSKYTLCLMSKIKNNFIYLLVAVLGLHCCMSFLWVWRWGPLFSCGALGSDCSGFSCCRASAFRCMGFSSCGMWAQSLQLPGLEHRLSSCSTWA